MEYQNVTLARTIIRFPLNNPNGTQIILSKCKHKSVPLLIGKLIFILKDLIYNYNHNRRGI